MIPFQFSQAPLATVWALPLGRGAPWFYTNYCFIWSTCSCSTFSLTASIFLQTVDYCKKRLPRWNLQNKNDRSIFRLFFTITYFDDKHHDFHRRSQCNKKVAHPKGAVEFQLSNNTNNATRSDLTKIYRCIYMNAKLNFIFFDICK